MLKLVNQLKDIVELVNSKFDNTGVSATATTTIKMQVNSSDALEIMWYLSIYMVKIQLLRQFQQQLKLAATTGASDMSNLRDAINAYTANTGIRATLSADKSDIILVQDEGEDVVIEDVILQLLQMQIQNLHLQLCLKIN